MTKQGKIEFIDSLIKSVHASILEKVDAMPDNWDGHELREYIAWKFQLSAYTLHCKDMQARYRAYKNDIATRPL